MKLINVAAGVLNQTPLDWKNNSDNIISAITQARDTNVSILCLPELCISGYGCEDEFHSPGIRVSAQEILLELLPHTVGMVVSFGVPLMYAGGIFNCAALAVDGRLVGFVPKQHLAGDGIHYEPRWFKAWPGGIHGEIEFGDQEYPIGDLIFDVGGVRIGFEICEDAWVGTRPGGSLAARGADIILNPSASHFAFDKHQVRQRFVLEGSRAFNVSYVYSNLTGNESGRAIFDGDAMIASGGNLLACGQRLSFKPVLLTSAIINVEATRMVRARTGSFEPSVDGDEDDVIDVDFEFPPCKLERPELVKSEWETNTDIKAEEFTRAVSLGLFDYLRKSNSKGFIVSLSGGCDSASVVALITSMLQLAEKELGFEALLDRLKWCIPKSSDDDLPKDVAELNHRLLTTVYQSTRNSGEVTRSAANKLAAAVNATHYEFDVDSLVQDYRTMVSKAIGKELTWEKHDIALQNIQARVRSPGVWMLANINNALLLSTSNRSEAAVGYATMDGDTSGGLSPIAGIDKAYLRQWLKWMEITGPVGGAPIPELKLVNDQQPTAELRPPEDGQTDEDDLMPYDILDAIECYAIRDKMVPLEVFEHIKVDFPDVDSKQLGLWTIRFFRLWCRNQWKRERYAPSFHLDDKNLDPKTWCRFPILSGGFRREIAELEANLKSSMA
ncbi:NAD(+) synthase [Mariniblastus fucicola]|uniref:Glutamine-dependent NAD(+) synthetase n=1 Tax=Mariniblastus fucicola TaxID=980251 RepID=A0A5B9P8N6_9BACT|nr:NAD(+) synthase [Mariniblastus fucicola]QEG21240.1 Glutamine-dependent NAD(+) synthetase [Mariniblastus fucicola]